MSKIICGVQLYTLRRYLKKPENVAEVFRKVKELGADTVQVSGMCKVEPKLLDYMAKENGLTICCTHSPFNRIINDLDKLAEEHLAFGAGVIGLGMMPYAYREGGYKRLNEFIEILNVAADKLKQYNLKIAYHNHAFEWNKVDDSNVYDIMIDKTDKSVEFILDTYWVRFAGQTVTDYIEKLKDRITVIHLKDYKKKLLIPMMCEVGGGELDFNKILKTAEECNTKYAVIELDFSINPYKSLAKSMNYLKDNYINQP